MRQNISLDPGIDFESEITRINSRISYYENIYVFLNVYNECYTSQDLLHCINKITYLRKNKQIIKMMSWAL